MKLSSTLTLVSIFTLTLLGACGGEGSFSSRVANAQEDHGEAFCRCAEVFGLTEEECLEELGDDAELTASQRDCVDEVYEAQSDDVKDAFDCQYDAAHDFATCLNRLNECSEDSLEACSQEYQLDLDDCDEIPASADDAYSACVD